MEFKQGNRCFESRAHEAHDWSELTGLGPAGALVTYRCDGFGLLLVRCDKTEPHAEHTRQRTGTWCDGTAP